MEKHSDLAVSNLAHSDLAFDVFGFGPQGAATSNADPEMLARAVRAHKAGDAFAQAAITFALMIAIGAVAFVLSSDRAAAADFVTQGGFGNWLLAGALAMVGGTLLARRLVLKAAQVSARRRHPR